jgi:hypothetical protein
MLASKRIDQKFPSSLREKINSIGEQSAVVTGFPNDA